MHVGWIPLCLALLFVTDAPTRLESAFASHLVQAAATAEYDAELRDWRLGQELQLRHPLFDLTRATAGAETDRTIVFAGKGHGTPGKIALVFFTLQGDRIYSQPGTVPLARVDEKQREFHLAAQIPSQLRGREGVVQVTFTGGGRRAAYLLKVHF